MRFQYAQGHNNRPSLADFPFEPALIQAVEYELVYAATAVGQPSGGGSARLGWAYLEKDEMVTLLAFLGVHETAPSRTATFLVPDLYGTLAVYNGSGTLAIPRPRDGLWRNVTLDLHALFKL